MIKRRKEFKVGDRVVANSNFIVGRDGHEGVVVRKSVYLLVHFSDGQEIPFYPEELSPGVKQEAS